jgi:para-nitrobenzyl esterase
MNLIINTESGSVEGLMSSDQKTRIFRGVPYAEPPIGELRFRRPEKKKSWTGVRPVKAFSPKAFQADLSKDSFYGKEFYAGDTSPMSEDCLYLNIWSPAEASGLPVLMWIHGGAYMHGYGSEIEFDGEALSKKGVIMVSVNYRVGSLGFFADDELESENPEHISGNYGFWDQIAALKWIYDNIENFGGDKNRITVAGQSAGCMSTQTLISTDLTRGMIHSAVLQSGGGIPGFASDYSIVKQKEISSSMKEYLGVKTVSELRKLSPEAICYAGYAMNGKYKGLSFMPNVDGYLLKKTVVDLALSGSIHDIPYIIGCTHDEMGNGTADMLRTSAVNFAANQEKLHKKPTYIYHFTRQLPGDDSGAFHSSELWYEFGTLKRCWRPFEQCDYDLSETMISYLTNFIKSDDPNSEGLPCWKPYTSSSPVRIRLDSEISEEKV